MARGLVCLTVSLVLCCGADGSRQDDQVDQAICLQNWRVLFTSTERHEYPPLQHDLGFSDSRLFFVAPGGFESRIYSVPVEGGAVSLLHEGWAEAFWLEDDQLLHTGISDLFSLPLAGGMARHLLHYAETGPFDGSPSRRALDRRAIYWMRGENQRFSVFRSWRDGSGEETVFQFPANERLAGVRRQTYLLNDQYVLSGMEESTLRLYVWVISTTTGEGRLLPVFERDPQQFFFDPFPTLLGASNEGALLWARPEKVIHDDHPSPRLSFLYALSNIDGSPVKEFATTIIRTAVPLAAWPTGAGGWYVAASEENRDEKQFITFWSVDATGKATRFACDPMFKPKVSSADPRLRQTITAGLVSPGALHVAVSHQAGPWQIATMVAP